MVSAKQSWQQRRAARKKMAAKVAKDLCEWLWEHNWDAFQLSGRIFPRDGNKNLGLLSSSLKTMLGVASPRSFVRAPFERCFAITT